MAELIRLATSACGLPTNIAGGNATWILGHDAVAGHRISLERVPSSDVFNIWWSGKIALAYVGDYEAKYSFRAEIRGVKFPCVAKRPC